MMPEPVRQPAIGRRALIRAFQCLSLASCRMMAR